MVLAEIQAALNKIFPEDDNDLDLSQFKLQSSRESSEVFEEVERLLDCKFPDSFVSTVLNYDLSSLDLGGVYFGSDSSYLDFLIEMNSEQDYPWWGNGVRPSNFVLVGGTEAYVVLLNISSEEIFTYPRDGSWSKAVIVAKNFPIFLMACGTIFIEKYLKQIEDERSVALNVGSQVGSSGDSEFWYELIQGNA
jgi:hypothetical protein